MAHSGKTITFATDLLPHENNVYSLGSTSAKWKVYGGLAIFDGYSRIDLTNQTVDLDSYTLSDGAARIRRYIERTEGGSKNISHLPVTGYPFILDVEVIRYVSDADYITLQTFRNAHNPNNEYVRYCTNGVWGDWTTRVFTDTNKYHKSGSWNGLTYTATAVNNADKLEFTIQTGTTATTVAAGNHNHDGVYAKLSSAAFTGTVTVQEPTADANPATKKYVDDQITAGFAANDAMVFKGVLNKDATATATVLKNVPASGYSAGWTYRVAKEGTYAGVACEVGDMVIAVTDAATNQTAVNNAHWNVIQVNIDGAVVSSSTSSTNNAIARFDEESGRIIQNSSTILQDDGTIKFAQVTSTSYPANSAGLSWSGDNDGASIYYSQRASNSGHLVLQTTDDNNETIIFRHTKKADSNNYDGVIISPYYAQIYPKIDAKGSVGISDNRWANGYYSAHLYIGPTTYTTYNSDETGTYIEPGGIGVSNKSAQRGYYLRGGDTQYSRWFIHVIGTASTAESSSGANDGTAGTLGNVILELGNNIANTPKNTAGGAHNARGLIRFYGNDTAFTQMVSNLRGNTSYNFWLPNYAGEQYATHVGSTSAVGSDIQPVYVAANGRVTAGQALWQKVSKKSTELYDFGVYVAQNTGDSSSPTGNNYYTILNVPYRKATGNTKADYGFQIGNKTDNDGRLWYRTSGSGAWGDWQTIAHATQSTTAIGGQKQPVYMAADGTITAGTALKNLAYKDSLIASDIPDISETYKTLNTSQFYGSENTSKFFSTRIKSDGGGWAWDIFRAYKSDKESSIAALSVYGAQNEMIYMYITALKNLDKLTYSNDGNIRIYPATTATIADGMRLATPKLTVGQYTAQTDESLLYVAGGGTFTDLITSTSGGIWIQGGSAAGGDNTRMSLTSGMPDKFPFNSKKRGTFIYSNAIAFADPLNGNSNNDAGWIRHLEETANKGILEIAVGDDNANEEIVVRKYNTSSEVGKEITLLDGSGNSSFPGQVTISGRLIVTGGTDAAGATANSGQLLIGDPKGEHIAIDGNEIMGKATGTTTRNLLFQNDGGDMSFSATTNTTNQFYIRSTTASSSTTTGALRVGGGAGIAGDLYVGGGITTANNTWNTIGDDAYLGDINKAGHIGIQGKNGNTGLFFTTYNQTTKTTGGAITWDGTKFSITSTTAIDADISGTAAMASYVDITELTTQNLNEYKNQLPTWYYAAGGNTVTNKPDDVTSFGMVVYRNAGNYRTQELYSSGGAKWMRYWNTSSWSTWEKVLTSANYNDYALPLSGGQMTGPLTWKDGTALPQKTSAEYFLAIDAFADGGKTYWISKANVLSSIGAAAADGSNASGTGWAISITGSAGSVAWANTGHPDTFPPTIGTTATTAMAGNTNVTTVAIAANDTSSTGTFPVTYAATNTSTTTAKNDTLKKSTGKLYFQPSTGTLTATKFSGPLAGDVTGDVTGNASSASKVSAALANNKVTYLLGTQTAITSTAANVTLTGDLGVYLTQTAGELSAYRYSWHFDGNERAYTLWNNSDQSIDFIFI